MGKVTTSGGSAGTTHATRGARNGCIFSRGVFLSGLDFGLVSLRRVGNGLVSLFSISVYSLGISVESRVLETSGLDSRSGLIMGDFFRKKS